VLGGVLVPAAAVTLWGLFAAPRAVVQVPVLAVLTKVVVLGSAVGAAFVVLPLAWAVVVAGLVVVNTALTWVGPFARRGAGPSSS
jgi:hypothetical protein